MSKCTVTGCPGHLGKFDDCLSEAVWQASMEGADRETGTVEYEGHLALVIMREPEFLKINAHEVWVLVDEGHYLVLTDDRGFVYVTPHEPTEARKIFDEFDARYCEWENDDDLDEIDADTE